MIFIHISLRETVQTVPVNPGSNGSIRTLGCRGQVVTGRWLFTNSYDGRELYEEDGPFYGPDPDSSPRMLGLVLIVTLIAWALVLGSLFYIITR